MKLERDICDFSATSNQPGKKRRKRSPRFVGRRSRQANAMEKIVLRQGPV